MHPPPLSPYGGICMQIYLSYEDKHISLVLDKDDDLNASCAYALTIAPKPLAVELINVRKADKNGKMREYRYKASYGYFSRIVEKNITKRKWFNIKGVEVTEDQYREAIRLARRAEEELTQKERVGATPELVADILISELQTEQLQSLLSLDAFSKMKLFQLLEKAVDNTSVQ